MKKAAMVLGILAGALTLACSTMTTAVDYDHTINWSQFKTFQLADGTKDPVTFTQKRIEDAVTGTLTGKGWQSVTSNPDILVFTHVALTEDTQLNTTNMGGMGYRGWGGMGGGMSTTTVQKIPMGTLVIDLVNPKSKEMVWRGRATDQVSGSGEDSGKIQEAVTKMFANFPPAPGSK